MRVDARWAITLLVAAALPPALRTKAAETVRMRLEIDCPRGGLVFESA